MPVAGAKRAPDLLSRIALRGFQSFQEQELTLGPLNVLVGANGAGKSSLVRFFEMLSFAMDERLRDWTRTRGSASSLLHLGPRRTSEIAGELEFVGDDSTSTYRFVLAHVPAGDELVFREESVRFLKGGKAKPFEKSWKTSAFESSLPGLVDSDNDTLRTVTRVFRNRLRGIGTFHFHDTSREAAIRLPQVTSQVSYLKAHGENLAAYLLFLRDNHTPYYRRICDEVRAVLPEFRGFELVPTTATPSRVQLDWRGSDPDYVFGPHQLSDGSLRAIGLITLLLQPESAMPHVIVIDEPELGLHPHAVGQIGRLLAEVKQRRQIIVSTQSPRLLTELTPEDVIVVDKEDGCSTLARLSTPELLGWLEAYDGDLGRLFEMNITGGAPR